MKTKTLHEIHTEGMYALLKTLGRGYDPVSYDD
jgi:hypothetical protein